MEQLNLPGAEPPAPSTVDPRKGPRTCSSCKGTKLYVRAAFDYNGRHYPEQRSACNACKGAGEFTFPDVKAIIHAIAGRKGLRSKRPEDTRAYYVWRWARFYGGADVTLPMTAQYAVHGDPFDDVLRALAERVAAHVYGTKSAGPARWREVLTGEPAPDGLPSSAYSSGPVLLDDNKPIEELLERS
jgi:hypothetical protein